MATVSFRIDDDLKARLDRVASETGLSGSDALRASLADAIDDMEAGQRPETGKLGLTLKERLSLHLQCRTMAKLYPDEKDHWEQHAVALENGYALHYDGLVEWFSDGLSREQCREVLEILNMYRSLTHSFADLTDREGIDPRDVEFEGFDGNEESRYHGYTRYFILTLGRFEELKKHDRPTFNSHSVRLDTYRRMLKVWRTMSSPNSLTSKEVKLVLNANYPKYEVPA